MGRTDDGSTERVDFTSVFENGLNFFGNVFNGAFINANGSITFNDPRSTFTPDVITAASNNPEITPFFGDVDTRTEDSPLGAGTTQLGSEDPLNLTPTPGGNSTGSDLVYWDFDLANDRFIVTWDDVGFFSQDTSKLNAFQLILTDRGEGNFDIEFRYEDIDWTTGNASGGSDGLGGTVARAGWTAGTGNEDEFFELPASGDEGAVLALEDTAGNTGDEGRWFFNVRAGDVVSADIPPPPTIPVTGAGSGDPHLTTLDGVGYDFQAAGEFVLLRDPNDPDFEIQVRMEPVGDNVSANTAVATVLGGQRVMIDARDATPLHIGGEPTTIEDFSSLSVGNGAIFREGDTFTIVYPGADGTVNAGDSRLVVDVRGGRVDLEATLSEERAGGLEGLLGDGDGNPANDVATADGRVLLRPFAFDEIYGEFRDDWRVSTQEQSLFDYDAGEGPDTFFQADFPAEEISVSDLDPAVRAQAEEAARNAGLEPGTANFNNAVLDFALTNDSSFLDSGLDAPTLDEEARVQTSSSAGNVALDFLELSVTQQLAGIYIGYFGRAPGPDGLDFWVGQYETGLEEGRTPSTILDDISESFRLADEAQALFPFLAPDDGADASRQGIEDFLGDVFQNLFNRDAGPGGLQFWGDEIQARLDEGIKLGDIIVDIMAGAQNGAEVDLDGDGAADGTFNDGSNIFNQIQVADDFAERIGDQFTMADARGILDNVGDTPQSVEDARGTIDTLLNTQALTADSDLVLG